MVNVKTVVLKTIRSQMLWINFVEVMVIKRAITDWPTPKIRSYTPSGENNKLDKNTPMTIPNMYFLLKTTKWLNISEMRNWIFVKPNGCTKKETAIYNAAKIPLTASVLIFMINLSLVFFRGMVSNHVLPSL